MGWRGTLVLSVLLVVVGVYFWFDQRHDADQPVQDVEGQRRPAPTRPSNPLMDFSPDEVTNIHLVLGGQTREAKREGKLWSGAADPSAITDFLNDLATLGVLSDIEAQPDELQDFGLQPPRSVFEAQVRGRQEPFTLQIGDHNPSTTGVYVRLGASGKVVLVGALLRWDFEQAFRSFAPVSEQ